MSWLSSFLNPQKGYEAAQNQYQQNYNNAQGYLNPYNQQGQQAFNPLFGAMQSLLDPQALQSKWLESYKESPAAKQAEGMAQEHGLNAASSLGLMGGSIPLQAIQAGTSQIGAEDRQNYMNDLMQKLMTGAGIGQGLYGTGANAAGQMSQNAMNYGNNAAQMAFGQQNAPGSLFGNLLGAGAGLLGGALGGPLGGALGAGLAQKMGWSPLGSYNPSGVK